MFVYNGQGKALVGAVGYGLWTFCSTGGTIVFTA